MAYQRLPVDSELSTRLTALLAITLLWTDVGVMAAAVLVTESVRTTLLAVSQVTVAFVAAFLLPTATGTSMLKFGIICKYLLAAVSVSLPALDLVVATIGNVNGHR